MIDIKNVSVRYQGTVEDALSDINVSFRKGDFVCILGKSGAGKSTFIRTLNGLQRTREGQIYLDGLRISNTKEKQMQKVRREMGMVFQHFNLIPRLTVIQNVLTGKFGYRNNFKSLIGWFSAEELDEAHRVISNMGLSQFTNRRVEQLSGGQKQRVGIARALVQQPKILLGDEPVASLDPGTSNDIFSLLKEIHDRLGLLTIINVHDIDLAKRYATRILALKDGRLTFDGSPEDFTEKDYRDTYQSSTEHLMFNH